MGELRAGWLRMAVDEDLTAVELGLDLRGVWLYPVLDMPDWGGCVLSPSLGYGLWDLVADGDGELRGVAHAPMLLELRRARWRV